MRRIAGAALGCLGLAGLTTPWLACSDAVRSHVYTGRQFDPTHDCLDDLQGVDVVAGPEPEIPCAPVCIVSDGTDASPSILYVSTMCGPYPLFPYESDAGSDPRCPAALRAYQYDTSCEPDGAILNLPPEAGPDAAADATLGPDAGVDASTATSSAPDAGPG